MVNENVDKAMGYDRTGSPPQWTDKHLRSVRARLARLAEWVAERGDKPRYANLKRRLVSAEFYLLQRQQVRDGQ